MYLECRLYEFDTCIVESIDCELSRDDLNRKIDLPFWPWQQFSCMTKLRVTGLLSSLYHVYAYVTRMILESEWRSDASLLLNSLVAPV